MFKLVYLTGVSSCVWLLGINCYAAGAGRPETVRAKMVVAKAEAKTYAPQNPAFGPKELYIYSNEDGKFVIGPGIANGGAKYSWQGGFHKDALTYMGYVELSDQTGIGVPQGQTYSAWLYEASDSSGNVWYLAFGVDKLQLSFPASQPRYGLYYSFNNPLGGQQVFMKRWLTHSGTTRQ